MINDNIHKAQAFSSHLKKLNSINVHPSKTTNHSRTSSKYKKLNKKQFHLLSLEDTLSKLKNYQDDLIGWEVKLEQDLSYIGYIKNVFSIENNHKLEYLKIINDKFQLHNNLDNDMDVIVHIVPLVSEIVKFLDINNQTVFLSPPEGLIELGYEQRNIKILGDELMQYCKIEEIIDKKVYSMPNAKRLEEAGRQDLIKKIKKYGGFLYVANALGWKAKRKPTGYWHEISNLDKEISLFIASCWKSYSTLYYNEASGRVIWDLPEYPESINIDDMGSEIFVEDPLDRVLPRRKFLFQNNRYDLHHAIVFHGGYHQVAELTERFRPSKRHASTFEKAKSLDLIRNFLIKENLNVIPNKREMKKYNEHLNIIQAINMLGGINQVSRELDL